MLTLLRGCVIIIYGIPRKCGLANRELIFLAKKTRFLLTLFFKLHIKIGNNLFRLFAKKQDAI